MEEKSSQTPQYFRDLFSLEGRVAIVTGGAGYIGSAISKGLASFGANVILIGRTESKLESFIKENNETFKNKFVTYVCDIKDQNKFKEIVNLVEKKYGTLDILVNNAYIKRKEKFEELTVEQWNIAIANNLTPYFTCSQAVIPAMKRKGKGSIINNASIYGFLGTDHRIFLDMGNNPSIHYAAIKGAITQMTRYLATFFAKDGIRVNTISPGYFPRKKPGDSGRPDYIEEICKRTPMGRTGNVEEIASASIFLASDASSFITGQNIIIDGGWSCW